MLLKVLKSIIYTLIYKIKYGKRLSVKLPIALDQVKIEKSRDAEISIGEKVQNRGNLYLGCIQTGKMKIGAHCFFNQNASLTCKEEITIGEYCKFGNNLVIVDHDHNTTGAGEEFISKPIKIGDYVWVGANCVILKGITIGSHAVIAAGSVVCKDVPEHCTYREERKGIISKKV